MLDKAQKLFRNVRFLIILIVLLFFTTLSVLAFAVNTSFKAAQLTVEVGQLTADVARLASQVTKSRLDSRKEIERLKVAQAGRTARLSAENKARLAKLSMLHRLRVSWTVYRLRAKDAAQRLVHQGALMTSGALYRLSLSGLQVRNKARVADAVLKAKAKARLQRYIVAVPVAGALAVAYFETQDFKEWKLNNPEGTLEEYGCLMYTLGQDVAAELQDDANRLIDEGYKKAKGWVPNWLKLKVPDLAGSLPPCADSEEGLARND